MKKLTYAAQRCDGCGKCEEVCSNVWHKAVNPEKSAIRITPKATGFDINVCNQCGECMEVCPTLALTRNSAGVIVLDKKKCVGCFSCIGFCPTLSMRRHREYLEPFKCVACGRCVKECTPGALSLENKG